MGPAKISRRVGRVGTLGAEVRNCGSRNSIPIGTTMENSKLSILYELFCLLCNYLHDVAAKLRIFFVLCILVQFRRPIFSFCSFAPIGSVKQEQYNTPVFGRL